MRLLISALCATLLSCLIPQHSFAQNEFVNLDFETFIPGEFGPDFGTLPGWGGGSLIPHAGLAPLDFLFENREVDPVTGVYSYLLASGFRIDDSGNPLSNALFGASISQTGLVPAGSVSLRLYASESPENWGVSLSTQELLFTEVGPNEYGANFPANFAGTTRRLGIGTNGGFYNSDDLFSFSHITIAFDNITFSSQPVEFPTLLGDANLDGIIDFSDIPAFIAVLSSGDYQREADCDQNEVVDFADIPAFVGILTNQ